MLDKDLLVTLHNVITQHIDVLLAEDSKKQTTLLNNEAKKGFIKPTGNYYSGLFEIKKESIKNRPKVIWPVVLEVLQAYMPDYYQEIGDDIKQELNRYFPENLSETGNSLEDPIFINNKLNKEKNQNELERVRCSSLHEIHNKVDLYSATISQKNTYRLQEKSDQINQQNIETSQSIKNFPKTILFTAANPNCQTPLRLDVEAREIEESFRLAKYRDQFVIQHQWATRIRDLRRAMQEHEPSIVHFCGHGSGEQGIVLENNEGKTQMVSTKALANFFELFVNNLECVVLNACFSEIQAKEIVRHIPFVIGMSHSISDAAAIEFAVGFYDALASGNDYEKAYKFGCNAIEMSGNDENQIPVFFKNSDQYQHNQEAKQIPS